MSTRAVPFGKYHLLERINVGGMAEVYRAKMVGVEGFEKQLAIKRILPAISSDKDFINMFIDEAKISVQLNHANIAQTFELGRINDTYFIALEYVPGRDLRAVFERMRRRGEVVPPELACYAVSRFCEGLDYAHRKKDVNGRDLGIIHRDISPQNILCSYEGEVKIIDFGIAKAANKIMKTQAGILKGKFGYMSPEQVRGLPLDRRSDIFAAGIVLYELLVGDRLFTGDSDYSILEKVRVAHVPRPSSVRKGVPAPLERIVSKALAKEPDERYHHASELVADLQRYLLAQEHLFTREDLAAFMKLVFAEEFEREKRAVQESFGTNEETPTARPDFDEGPANNIRPGMRDGRARPEGGSARPASPPPPPADAFMNTDPAADRGQLLSAPKGRLAQARQSAETDRLETTTPGAPLGDEEETATETEPLPGSGRPPAPPIDHDELTPTPEDLRFRRPGADEALVTDLPTRIGRAAPLPPPVASGPPKPRAAQSLPPRNVRMPARITDSLPEPARRAPPPIAFEHDDEPTVMEDAPALKPRRLAQAAEPELDATTPEGNRAVPPPPRPPTPRPLRAPPPSIVIGDEETTSVGSRAQPYSPRRRQSWAIVPIAVSIALAIALVVLKARPFGPRAPDAPVEPPPTLPLATAPIYGGVTITTDPADAVVFIDEKIVKGDGDKPFTTDRLEADVTHAVRITKDGFREAMATVIVSKGEKKALEVRLKAQAPTLTVKTTPPGAVLYVDEREVARTPEKLATLAPGRHALRVELKCYAPVSRNVDLSEGDQLVDIVLPPIPGACAPPPPRVTSSEPGFLRLMSRPPARIWLDGVDTGKDTPLLDQPIAPGRHKLRLAVGQKEKEEEIEIKPGERLVKVVVLQ